MKTYQKIIASLFLLATSILSCSKGEDIKLPKFKPEGEYSKYFEKQPGEIKDESIINMSNKEKSFGVVYKYEYDGDLIVGFRFHKGRHGNIMRLKGNEEGLYRCIELMYERPLELQEDSYHWIHTLPCDLDEDGDTDFLMARATDNNKQPINYLENLKGIYIDRGPIATFDKSYPKAEIRLFITDYDLDGRVDLIVTDSVSIDDNKGVLFRNNLPQNK